MKSGHRWNRAEKWLLASVPLGLLLLGGSALWNSRLNASPQVVAIVPIVRPAPNGYDVYVASARALVKVIPAVDPIYDTQNLLQINPKLAAKNYSLARRNAWRGANARAWTLFERAKTLPVVHPDARPSPMVAFAGYGPLRELARAKGVEARTWTLAKRPNDAVHSGLDAIQMGNDIARGGITMARLAGLAMCSIGLDPLTTNAFLPEQLSAAQARVAANRLEAILNRHLPLHETLEEDRQASLSEFARQSNLPNWRDVASYAQNPEEITWQQQLEARVLSKQSVVDQINASFDAAIRDAKTPHRAPLSPDVRRNPLVEYFGSPNVERLKINEARFLVPMRVLLLRFALRAYRLENGAFPANLAALAPRYLKRIPLDHYADDAPFNYRVKAGKYELWSIGPDGVNNGGRPLSWRNGTQGVDRAGRFPTLMPDSVGDYVAGQNR